MDSKYILVCMPINKSDHIEHMFKYVIEVFEPEIKVVRVENIPGDWAAVLRKHIASASLILFDMSRIDLEFNHHVLRELAYITTMILDVQAEYDIAPTFIYMHRDDLLSNLPNFSYKPAQEIDYILCHSESNNFWNNMIGRRSICVFDYAYSLSVLKFKERLLELKKFTMSLTRPTLFNHVVTIVDKSHPILLSATSGTGVNPYYLRDEQYDGFELAKTSFISEPDDRFWENLQRVFRFSMILRHHIQSWLLNPNISTIIKFKILQVIKIAQDDGYIFGNVFIKVLDDYMKIEQNIKHIDIAKEIINNQESESERRERVDEITRKMNDVRYATRYIDIVEGSNRSNLIVVTIPTELTEAICFSKNKDWASFFKPENCSIHENILKGNFVQSRYFSVLDIEYSGLFEDALDRIGYDIQEIVRQMIACQYSEYQIESTVRATIVLCIVNVYLKNLEQGETLIKSDDSHNLLEIIWNSCNLHRFKFESTTLNQVTKTYIPWVNIRERAIRYAARKAADLMGVDFREIYEQLFRNDEYPQAQLWGGLLGSHLFDICEPSILLDWWVKYAIPMNITSGEALSSLIVDPLQIDLWAPIRT